MPEPIAELPSPADAKKNLSVDLYDLLLAVVLVITLATAARWGSTLLHRIPAAMLVLLAFGALFSPAYRQRLRGVWVSGAVLGGAVALYLLPVLFADEFIPSLQTWLVWGHRLMTTWLALCLVLPGRVVGLRLLIFGVLAWLSFHAVIGHLQWYGFIANLPYGLLTGTTGVHVYMGLMLGLGLILSCGLMATTGRPWLFLPLALLFSLPLPITGARNGWVGAAIGMVVILFAYRRQRQLWFCYGVITLTSLASLTWGALHIRWIARKIGFLFTGHLNGRGELWAESMNMQEGGSRFFDDSGHSNLLLWLGHGLSLRHLSSSWMPHNVLLETYLTGGLVGLVALLSVFFMVSLRLWRRFPDPSGVTWILLAVWLMLIWMCLFDFSIYSNQRVTLIIALLIGTATAAQTSYNPPLSTRS